MREGEILGIAGVEGNGQTELIEALAGLIAPAHLSGEIRFEDRNIAPEGARLRRELRIAHIPEDRHRRGLLLEFDLAENSILGVHYRKPIVGFAGVFLDNEAVRNRANEIIEKFDVRPANPDLPARALSGGNQQKLIIGREVKLILNFCWFRSPLAELISALSSLFIASWLTCATMDVPCCLFRRNSKR